ncbi:hypothetical protein Nepgr_019977 [Nepenthes gracilis]|uniref:Uncharacterized protein n=1 Tax=Nepenthes gracilis TaxID=150966 RepID=A0AAD3XVW8_NEPGR|nr:hypothetical protein Nepgr_019977 [Nepenthes gracilis]
MHQKHNMNSFVHQMQLDLSFHELSVRAVIHHNSQPRTLVFHANKIKPWLVVRAVNLAKHWGAIANRVPAPDPRIGQIVNRDQPWQQQAKFPKSSVLMVKKTDVSLVSESSRRLFLSGLRFAQAHPLSVTMGVEKLGTKILTSQHGGLLTLMMMMTQFEDLTQRAPQIIIVLTSALMLRQHKGGQPRRGVIKTQIMTFSHLEGHQHVQSSFRKKGRSIFADSIPSTRLTSSLRRSIWVYPFKSSLDGDTPRRDWDTYSCSGPFRPSPGESVTMKLEDPLGNFGSFGPSPGYETREGTLRTVWILGAIWIVIGQRNLKRIDK